MTNPRAPRRGIWCGLLAIAMVTSTLQAVGTPAASADDEPIVVHIESPPIPGGTGTEEPLRVVENVGTGQITVTNPGGTAPTTQQCVRGVTNLSFCLGTSDQLVYPNDTDLGPITITGAPSQEAGLPGTDLDWIIDEAVSSVAQVHGVRADDLVRSYARPEIRGYVAMRINDILNKKLYGVPMTHQETRAYEALEALYQERLVNKAKAALREYDLWSQNPCLYPVPSPPPGSGLPYVANEVASSQACSAVGGYASAFRFSKNTPPVEVFDAWAAYRNPSPLVEHGGDPNVIRMLGDSMDSYVSLGGVATALATAGATGATISALNLALIKIWYVEASSQGAITWTLASGGVASVVAAVVIAAIIAGIAIWKIVEDEKPGNELRRRVAEALANDDPFEIEANQATYADLDYATLEDPAEGEPALTHQESFTRQLAANTYEWMMFDGDGDLVVDPLVGWNSAGVTLPDDLKLVDAGNTVHDPLVVLAPDGTVDIDGREISGYFVKIAHGWLLVSTVYAGEADGGPYEPRLSLRYDRGDGTPAMMSLWRDMTPGQPEVTRFLHNYLGDDDELEPEISDTWTMKSLGGVVRTVHLDPSEPVLPEASVVPSVHGNLVADNLVELQANPSPGVLGGGGDFSWTLQRLDPAGDVAETVPVPAGNVVGFQKRLSTPGRYRALVEYAEDAPSTVTAAGRVEFTVLPPQPEVLAASIKDDRVLNGALSLDLRLLQDTPSDTFDVTVEWADDARGNTAVEHYTVQCEDAGSDTCDTGPLIAPVEAPVNANWSASPTYRIDDEQNFLPQVSVTITNGYGNTITRVFPVVGDHRPSYATMTPSVEMPAGTFSRIDVVEVFPSPLLEEEELFIQPYISAIIEQLPEGIQPDLDERDGHWYLQLAGHPQADAIGTYPFYFPFEQAPPGAGLRPPPALVTLEIKAASEPGYRSVLRGTPTEFLDRDYRNTYPEYVVQVTQVLGEDDEDFEPFTGAVMCKLEAGPTVVFDEPCDVDEPFPWPEERISSTLVATTYVESDTQPVSTDGPYSVNLMTRFLDPQLTRVEDAPEGVARFELTLKDQTNLPVLPPFAEKGYTVECSEDDGPFEPCLDSGVIDLPDTPGGHTLAVRVTAPDDATTTEVVEWSGEAGPTELVVNLAALPAQPRQLKQRFTLGLVRDGAVEPPFGTNGYIVTCSYDGGGYAPCFDGGTLALLRVPGKHTLDVRVEALDDGATVERHLTWKVATPPTTLTVKVPAKKKARGAKVLVRASGLLPGERYVIRIGGRKAATGTATAKGKVRVKVKIPTNAALGKVKVKVRGATAKRVGVDGLQVVRP